MRLVIRSAAYGKRRTSKVKGLRLKYWRVHRGLSIVVVNVLLLFPSLIAGQAWELVKQTILAILVYISNFYYPFLFWRFAQREFDENRVFVFDAWKILCSVWRIGETRRISLRYFRETEIGRICYFYLFIFNCETPSCFAADVAEFRGWEIIAPSF